MKKHKLLAVVLAVTISVIPSASLAHGGRTDSSGDHHDYKNASGPSVLTTEMITSLKLQIIT